MPKDNMNLAASIIAASLFVLLLMVASLLLFRIYLKRKNKLLLEKERMSIQFEQTLLYSKLEIQEQTFSRISQEIHDNIGQVLSMVRINLNTLAPTHDQEKIEMMDQGMEKAITDLRTLSHSLDTDLIRTTGWVKAFTRLLHDLEKTGQYTVVKKIQEPLPTLGTEKPVILFRMLQEMINNIIKHADASEIQFEVGLDGSRIVVELSDNGKGFDTAAQAQGVGLKNLATRAKMIDADLFVDSIPGRGTKVSISINAEPNE